MELIDALDALTKALARTKYSEDQPRDDHATKAIKYSPDQPRDDHGRFGESGDGSAFAPVNTSRPAREAHLRSVVDTVENEMGITDANVRFVWNAPPSFTVGDKVFSEGGHYEAKTEGGTIEINASQLGSDLHAEMIAAHELTHHAWATVREHQDIEHAAIAALPKDEYNALFSTGGYVRPDKLAEVHEKYPTSAMLAKYIGDSYMETEADQLGLSPFARKLKTLEEDDGVTEYSKAYWAPEAVNTSGGWERAVNETLAELSAIHYGKTAVGAAHRSPLWNEFRKDVLATYKRVTSKPWTGA